MSGTRAISTTSRRELPSNFFPLQGKAPKEIHAILTEILACFHSGRTKDLSASIYSETKVEFRTNLQQMFQMCGHRPRYTANNDAAETDVWTKNVRLQPDDCCCLKIRAIRCPSESTGDVSIRALMLPHRKKCIAVRSGDLGGQAIGPPCPIPPSL